jgi:hypothetical protein
VDGAKKANRFKDGASGNRPILQWQNSWFTGCDGNLANLERKITTPGVQLPIRKVYQPILKVRRIWCCFKEQSMTYYGYKLTTLSRSFLVCSNNKSAS